MKKTTLVVLALLTSFHFPALAHQHFGAGIADANANGQPDPGEALRFVNPPPAGAVFHLKLKAPGQKYGGFYSLDGAPRESFPDDYFSFIALSAGIVEAAAPDHAALGSSIWVQVTSVTGPANASFGFWEESHGSDQVAPTQSFSTAAPTGDFPFILSESGYPPTPDEDPQGHIHGRAFTVDQPGTYVVSFRLVDRSTNGPSGGPIHSPSITYSLTFQAGDGPAPTPPGPTPPPTATPAPLDAPTVRVAGPRVRIVRAARVVLRGQAAAAAGLKRVEIKVNGGRFRPVAPAAQWQATVRLVPGKNRLTVRSVDALGRTSPSRIVTVERR